MKLSIKENSKNYVCTVVEINKLFPIENADKIQRSPRSQEDTSQRQIPSYSLPSSAPGCVYRCQ